MKPSGTSRLNKFLSGLPGRIMLVVSTSVVVAAVIPLLFFFNQTILPAALKVVAIACIGIASGFATRLLLNTSTRILSMLVAVIAVFASLWLLSILTAGYIGIQPFHAWSNPDWHGLFQLILGAAITWLTLRAWRKPVQTSRITTRPAGKRKQTTRTTSAQRRNTLKTSTRIRKNTRLKSYRERLSSHFDKQLPQFVQSQYWADKLKNFQYRTRRSIHLSQVKITSLIKQPVNRANSLLTRPHVRTQSSLKSIQVRSRRPKVRSPKKTPTHVRLTGAVEHRCPFCLEIVGKNDARGVKVCSICHTHHHADCWEVTGTCQVPHLHE